MDLPSCSAVVHVTEACDVTVVACITALVFTIDVCNGFGHAWEKKLAKVWSFGTNCKTYQKAE
jgi:hypothetical protein